jgi:UDP-N-acetylglucosamine transferase subunit ALG13
MIFVVLGTWGMPFTRPLAEIEQAAARELLSGPIVVQSGTTSFTSSRMRLVPYFGTADFQRMYDEAALVICQAGVGSIMTGLQKGKTVIAIARRAGFNEHIDDHQLEILEVFSRLGAVISWKGEGDLGEALARAEGFVSAGYPFAQEKISDAILDYLADKVAVS